MTSGDFRGTISEQGKTMPIGIVSDAQFQEELNSLQSSKKVVPSPVEILEKEVPTRGRKEGDNNIPESLRKIIGEESVINGRQSALQLAGEFGISPSSVSAYAKGATSTTTYDTPNKSLIQHINKARGRHIKKASHVLNSALSAISQEKLDYADAKDLSGIAKDMAVIIKQLEPQSEVNVAGTATPQFVIFAPQFRDERTFESIVVNE